MKMMNLAGQFICGTLNLLFIFGVGSVYAQEEEPARKEGEHKPQIRGAIMMANSHVPKSFEGDKKVAVLPTWGVDVDYFFHPRWSAAVQADIILQDFEVEIENAVLERVTPVALLGALHYHALRHWSFYLGTGVELAKDENFFMMRLGTEYSFEITENFEIGLNLIFDNKDEVYDTWTFGIAFNKKLWGRE